MPFTHLSSIASVALTWNRQGSKAFWVHDSLWDSRYLPEILLMVSFLGALTYLLVLC